MIWLTSAFVCSRLVVVDAYLSGAWKNETQHADAAQPYVVTTGLRGHMHGISSEGNLVPVVKISQEVGCQ